MTAEPLPGHSFNEYVPFDMIYPGEEGGFCVISVSDRNNRTLAMKLPEKVVNDDEMIDWSLISDEELNHFNKILKREIRINSLISKSMEDRVVKMLDYGLDLPWMVMELTEGTAMDMLNNSMDGPREKLVKETVETVSRLHKMGIAHLDIKPENIHLKNGRWKLGDFESSVIVGEHPHSSFPCGSIGYMAPEQAQIPNRFITPIPLDERTDVFQLGALIYRVETGTTIFPERTYENDILLGTPDFEIVVDRNFRTILEKALSKKKENRYKDATEMLSDVVYASESHGQDMTALKEFVESMKSKGISMDDCIDSVSRFIFSGASSYYSIGLHYAKKGEYEKAHSFLKKAADGGVVEAHCALGELYEEGRIPGKGMDDAIREYDIGSEKGDTKAMCKASEIMIRESDRSTAFAMLSKAVFLEDPHACLMTAAFHFTDSVAYSSQNKCFRWCLIAADKGDVRAMRLMGKMYFEGYHVKRSLETSRTWFKRSADEGDEESEEWLRYIDGGCKGQMYDGMRSLSDDFEFLLPSADEKRKPYVQTIRLNVSRHVGL